MIEGATCVVIVIADRQAARWRTLAAEGEPEAAEAESGEPNNSLDKNRPDEFMKLSNRSTRFSRLFTIVLLAGAWGLMTEVLPAAESKEAPQKPAITQRIEYTDFDLPEIDIWVGPVDERTYCLLLPNEY